MEGPKQMTNHKDKVRNKYIMNNTIKYYIYHPHILYIYNLTINEYLNKNTPCKECLVNPTCLNDKKFTYGKSNLLTIEIKLCDQLKKFIENNKEYINVSRVKGYGIKNKVILKRAE
jgi:hypothetical protein